MQTNRGGRFRCLKGRTMSHRDRRRHPSNRELELQWHCEIDWRAQRGTGRGWHPYVAERPPIVAGLAGASPLTAP